MRSIPASASLFASALTASLLVNALASAQVRRTSAGFTLTQVISGVPSSRLLWVDSHGSVIAQPLVSTLPVGPLTCYRSKSGGGAEVEKEFPTDSRDATLGVGAGRDDVVVVAGLGPSSGASADLYRFSCRSAAVPLGKIVFSTELSPGLGSDVWAMDAAGALYYGAAGGLAKLEVTPLPAASLVVSNAALDAAVGKTGGSPPNQYRISTVTVFPDGRLAFVARLYTVDGRVAHDWIIERSTAGVLDVRWSNVGDIGGDVGGLTFGWQPRAVYEPSVDAVMIDHAPVEAGQITRYPALAILPQKSRPDFSKGLASWPASAIKLLGGSLGAYAYDVDLGGSSTVHQLTYVAGLADFDRDGLRASEERALGTNDFTADSDGDGVADFAEARLFATSPTDRTSVPDVAPTEGVVLGASLFAGLYCARSGSYNFAPVSTTSCEGSARAYTSDLKPVPGLDGVVGKLAFPPSLALAMPPEASPISSVFTADAKDHWSSLDLARGTSQPFVTPFTTPIYGAPIPLSATRMLLIESTVDGFRRLWRVGPGADGERFAVFDVDRAGCPILASAADLPTCDGPERFDEGAGFVFDFAGYDPEKKRALFGVTTSRGHALYGVTESSVTFLADLTTALGGLRVKTVLPLSSAGLTGQIALGQTEGGGVYLSTTRLDRAYAPVTPAPPWVAEGSGGIPPVMFRDGYLNTITAAFLLEPRPGGPCLKGEDCRLQKPQTPKLVNFEYPGQWVPIRQRLEKGEVISFSAKRHNAATVLNRHTGLFEGSDPWMLWRTTPAGGTVEWLDKIDFTSKLAPDDKAALTTVPLGPITAINASPDSLKICLAESGAQRVWEISLSASTRKLERIALASRGSAAGCAYDEKGAMGALGGSPLAIRSGSDSFPISLPRANGLYRIGGRWIAVAHGANALCVEGAGNVTDSTVSVVAMAPSSGGLAYVDVAGDGFFTTADRFCAGKAPLERMIAKGGVWDRLVEPFTFRTPTVTHAAMAVRPDGLVFLATDELLMSGFGAIGSDVVPDLLFHVFPAYQPLGDGRLPENDLFRLATEVVAVTSIDLLDVGAMAILPGASAGRDWGYVNRPGTPAPAPPPIDPGVGGSPPAATGAGAGGCGCESAGVGGPGDASLVLLMVMAWIGRARGRRGARPSTGRRASRRSSFGA